MMSAAEEIQELKEVNETTNAAMDNMAAEYAKLKLQLDAALLRGIVHDRQFADAVAEARKAIETGHELSDLLEEAIKERDVERAKVAYLEARLSQSESERYKFALQSGN